MTKVYVTHRMSVPRKDAPDFDLRPGFREVPDDVLDHDHVKASGFRRESDLNEAEKAEAERVGADFDSLNIGVQHNIPQSDVEVAGAADARVLIEGDPAKGEMSEAELERRTAPKTRVEDDPAKQQPKNLDKK